VAIAQLPHVKWVDSANQTAQVASGQQPGAVLLPAQHSSGERVLAAGEGYIGRISLSASMDAGRLKRAGLVRWIILRTAVTRSFMTGRCCG